MAGLQEVFTALTNIAQNLGRLVTQTSLGIVVPIAQGGTGATTAASARANLGIGLPGSVFAGSLIGADMNSTADQPIALTLPAGVANWLIEAAIADNPSISLTAAVGGIYTGPGATGIAVVSASQHYSGLTTNAPNTAGSALVLTLTQNAILTVTTLYLHLTTPQGATAAADFRIYARPLY